MKSNKLYLWGVLICLVFGLLVGPVASVISFTLSLFLMREGGIFRGIHVILLAVTSLFIGFGPALLALLAIWKVYPTALVSAVTGFLFLNSLALFLGWERGTKTP